MTNKIAIQDQPVDWQKEFQVDLLTGQVTGSRRALARLCGVRENTIRNTVKLVRNKTVSKALEPFTGQDFEGAQLPDIFMMAVVQHYAFKGMEIAQQTVILMGAIGLRAYAQKALGYQPAITGQPQVESPVQPLLSAVPEISTRNQIRKLVDDYAFFSGQQHERVWRNLYRQMEYRHGYDISKKKCKGSKLDQIEADGMLDKLLAIAQLLLTIPTLN
jgi:hypothetical protein